MAPQNLEEAVIDRIRRAVKTELKALRRVARPRNGHSQHAGLAREKVWGTSSMWGQPSSRGTKGSLASGEEGQS